MRLVMVELNRFRSRRAIALMLLGVLLLVGWMTVDTIWQTRPVTSTQIAAAKEQAAAEQEFMQEEYQRCKDDPDEYFGGEEGFTAEDCGLPESDYRWYLDRAPLSLAEELDDTGMAALVILAGVAMIIGTTFAGSDWSTRSMSNQLLFRPRRLQVWAAKGAAVALAVAVTAAVVIAAQWGAYALTASLRHLDAPHGFTGDLLESLGRGLVLIVGAALCGYALSMLLRSTVGTLAVLFFVAVGGEVLTSILPFDHAAQWSPGNNVAAWLQNGLQVYDESIPCFSEDACEQTFLLSGGQAATYLAVLLVLAVVASVVTFRRRDVP